MTMRLRPERTYNPDVMIRIVDDLYNRVEDLERAINQQPYIITNYLEPLREIDLDTVTFDELKVLVATLITDFKTVGRLF